MTSKIIHLNNDNYDPKIKDLYDKASKNGHTNLSIKEFSELVEELTALPIQNSKITFKILNHILQDTKYDKHNLCDCFPNSKPGGVWEICFQSVPTD